MKLQIHAPGVEIAPELYASVERRMRFVLTRFAPRIARVDLYLSDENGPGGVVETSCRLSVILLPYGMLAVQDNGANMDALIERAVDRLARSVRRELERRRTQSARTLWENG